MAATAQTKASSPATVSSISSFDTRTAVHELPPTRCSVVPRPSSRGFIAVSLGGDLANGGGQFAAAAQLIIGHLLVDGDPALQVGFNHVWLLARAWHESIAATGRWAAR